MVTFTNEHCIIFCSCVAEHLHHEQRVAYIQIFSCVLALLHKDDLHFKILILAMYMFCSTADPGRNNPEGPCPFCTHCKDGICAGDGGPSYYQCPKNWRGNICEGKKKPAIFQGVKF